MSQQTPTFYGLRRSRHTVSLVEFCKHITFKGYFLLIKHFFSLIYAYIADDIILIEIPAIVYIVYGVLNNIIPNTVVKSWIHIFDNAKLVGEVYFKK